MSTPFPIQRLSNEEACDENGKNKVTESIGPSAAAAEKSMLMEVTDESTIDVERVQALLTIETLSALSTIAFDS